MGDREVVGSLSPQPWFLPCSLGGGWTLNELRKETFFSGLAWRVVDTISGWAFSDEQPAISKLRDQVSWCPFTDFKLCGDLKDCPFSCVTAGSRLLEFEQEVGQCQRREFH